MCVKHLTLPVVVTGLDGTTNGGSFSRWLTLEADSLPEAVGVGKEIRQSWGWGMLRCKDVLATGFKDMVESRFFFFFFFLNFILFLNFT